MHTYSDTLTYLYGLQYRGMKFGLKNIRTLLREAGNPERRFPSIHVAGTNGKGSTASFIASVFMEAGCRTGLYTSPHLVRFTERIRIGRREIVEARLVRYVEALRPVIESVHATFFEATTCVAFLYFADEAVDIAIVEVGLGGRLDATNVLTPMISVITTIALDHTEYLGTTIRAIAGEKGGIIKPGVPAVTSSTDRRALATLGAIARRKGTRLYRAGRLVRLGAGARGGEALNLRATTVRTGLLVPGLTGPFQRVNARLAIAAIDLLRRRVAFRRRFRGVTAAAVRRGLINVRRNSGLRGRLELFPRGKRLILDVAHNPSGMDALVSALLPHDRRDVVAVFGVMKDKDYRQMLRALAGVARIIVAVSPDTPRALSSVKLRNIGRRLGIPVLHGGSVRRGTGIALRKAGSTGRVLVTGSHYVVGEALRFLRGRKT